jgi:regulator of nonsense transcripts 1
VYNDLRNEAEQYILNKADVICATCIASGDYRLKDFTFNHVLIDEATQAIEPAGLLPMLKSARHVILVGDHIQLGPVVLSKQASKAGLNKCLFERLVKIGHKPIML